MSKGSKPRPFVVSNEEYESRWDAIFGKDKPIEPESVVEVVYESNDPTPVTSSY